MAFSIGRKRIHTHQESLVDLAVSVSQGSVCLPLQSHASRTFPYSQFSQALTLAFLLFFRDTVKYRTGKLTNGCCGEGKLDRWLIGRQAKIDNRIFQDIYSVTRRRSWVWKWNFACLLFKACIVNTVSMCQLLRWFISMSSRRRTRSKAPGHGRILIGLAKDYVLIRSFIRIGVCSKSSFHC